MNVTTCSNKTLLHKGVEGWISPYDHTWPVPASHHLPSAPLNALPKKPFPVPDLQSPVRVPSLSLLIQIWEISE